MVMVYMHRVRIVVGSPGDVQSERDKVVKAVEELNQTLNPEHNVLIQITRWETDAFPGFHADGPQGLIDSILRIGDCDIFIGIFHQRFGTPTFKAQSGTEHEINQAYESWKQKGTPHIMIYFKEPDHVPTTAEEAHQLAKVLEFKHSISNAGLVWNVKKKEDFARLIRDHLRKVILEILHSSQPINAVPLVSVPSKEPANQNNGAIPSSSPLVFHTTGGLTDPNEFFGRKQDYKQLVEQVLKGESTSIVDENRVGKTWFLDYFCLKAQEELRSNYLICRLYAFQCQSEIRFVKALLEELNKLGIDTKIFDHAPFGTQTIEKVVNFFKEKGKTLVLCIDRFENIQGKKFSQMFFAEIRDIAEGIRTAHSHLVLVTASKCNLKDVIATLTPSSVSLSLFQGIFTPITLTPFNSEDAKEFVEVKGAQAGFTKEEKSHLLLYSEEKGTYPPLRLQLLGRLIQEEQRRLGTHLSDDENYWKELVERVERMYQSAVH